MTLFTLVLRVTAVLVLTLAAAALARRRSAALRHWILAAGIGCALAMPALALILPSWGVIAAAAPPSYAPEVRETFVLPEAAAPAAGPVQPVAVLTATDMLLRVWFAGTALGVMSLLGGLGRLSRITSGGRLVEGEWQTQAADLAQAMGLRAPVAFRETSQPGMLVTWGARRPVVLLPEGAASWPADRIRIVAAHELAHVWRGDWPVQLAGELLRVLYWFHPLAWLVCRRLREESEYACDDVVLAMGIARTDYATELVELARAFNRPASGWLPASAIARSSTLQRRIRAMLTVHLDRRPLSRFTRWCGVGLMLLATAPIAAIGRQSSATVSGTVSDPSGRAVAGVAVTLANASGDLAVEIKTNQDGAFSVPVIAGTYQLQARHPGFAVQREQLTLADGAHVQRSLVLRLGTIQESVTVAGGAAIDSRPPRRAQPAPRECTPSAAGGRIVPPLKVTDVHPIYPPDPIVGAAPVVVPLEARIDVNGTVQDAQVTATVPEALASSALTAVRQWEFTPALLNCEPVAVAMLVKVTFQSRP
jgi:beta-lactamase regulating signal transducer with metallopeptidase domain